MSACNARTAAIEPLETPKNRRAMTALNADIQPRRNTGAIRGSDATGGYSLLL